MVNKTLHIIKRGAFLALLFATLIELMSCSQLDKNEAPIIQILGSNPDYTLINTPYIDSFGIYNYHNFSIEDEWVNYGNINTSEFGNYTITYGLEDEHGNVATADRDVIVYANGFSYSGLWSVEFYDSMFCTHSHIYLDSLTFPTDSSVVFNRFANCEFSDVHGYFSGVYGDSIYIPEQRVFYGELPSTLSGFGVVSKNADTINFTITEQIIYSEKTEENVLTHLSTYIRR